MSVAPEIPHPLPAPLVELIAERFRVLAEPMRIRLLDALRESAATVQELQARTDASQQNVSKHLGPALGSAGAARRALRSLLAPRLRSCPQRRAGGPRCREIREGTGSVCGRTSDPHPRRRHRRHDRRQPARPALRRVGQDHCDRPRR
ncbi:MAG TPA: helix-turn-helix domain-containing protein [Solirubrobacteraceae bacterium]